MDLFERNIGRPSNLLPMDGEVFYWGPIAGQAQANDFYKQLLSEVPWENDAAIMFGKRIVTKRKVAWYGDQPFSYTYSRVTKQALGWNQCLLSIKSLVEGVCGVSFNSCLLNLYHSGDEGMAWHSDDEKELKVKSPIASFTLGAERRFLFKHKGTGERVGLVLEHGSLLVMAGSTQSHWLHRLPQTKKVSLPRINLTFRCMNES